ncbi:Mu transposase C-terminal domain-containing protein [Desulfatibacillum aliphaticivorans]|nr:Mu transposase C-terminal domain-containing protein [Desulfatibacillum aliphaticivorans]
MSIQRAIIEKELNAQDNGPAPPPESVLTQSSELAAAPGWNMDRAYARRAILEASEKYCTDNGLSKTQADTEFSDLFAKKTAPGLEPWVYMAEKSLSQRKLQRLRAAYSEDGLAGLLTKHGKTKGRITAIPPDMRLFIIGKFKEKPSIRIAHLTKLIETKFGKPPARETIKKFLHDWMEEDPGMVAMLKDPRKWKNNYMPAFGDAGIEATYFCAVWEMDSTPADVITADGKRCACVGAIDVYSRRAKLFFAPTSKSTAIAACMRKALLAWGVPTTIRMDNGADYQSDHVEAICRGLRIRTPELPKYTPEKKPFIERFFGTFSKNLEELLPGYCGHSVSDRQEIRERATWAAKIMKPGDPVEVPYTMEQLQAVTEQWLTLYESQPHRGLGGKTPMEAMKESPLSPQQFSDERALDVLLAPVARRKVGKKGISIDNEIYVSPELAAYVGWRVEVRRDMQDVGLIYVFSARTMEFLCTARNEPLTGLQLEEYIKAKKSLKKEIERRVKVLEEVMPASPTAVQVLLADAVANAEPVSSPYRDEANSQEIEEARKAAAAASEENQDGQGPPLTVVSPGTKFTWANVTDKRLRPDLYDEQYYEEKFKEATKSKQNGTQNSMGLRLPTQAHGGES